MVLSRVKIVFVETTENKSDMLKKNVSDEAYDEHIDNYIMDHKDITHNG
jgi:tRNA1(Val) A37 N6-methylase TrmN6